MLTAWGGIYTTKKRTEVTNFCKSLKAGDGGYGTLTQSLIRHLKTSLTNEKYPDNDANTIKPDFVNRMLKEFKLIKESKSYHGLSSRLLLSEDIAPEADPVADVVYTPKDKVLTPKDKIVYVNSDGTRIESNSNKKSSATGKYKELQSNTAFEYTIKDNVWHCRKKGTTDTPFLVTRPASIKELVKKYFNEFNDGYFIMLKDGKRFDSRLYRFSNKKWEVQISGSWDVVSNQQSLIDIYGTDPLGAGGSKPTTPLISTKTLDDEIITLGVSIKSFVEGGKFSAYKGGLNDDEESAWNDVLYPQWKTVWKKKIAELRGKILKASPAISESDKGRYDKSFKAIEKMFTDGVGNTWVSGNTFYGTFHKGAITSDTWELMLYLSGSTVKKLLIDADF